MLLKILFFSCLVILSHGVESKPSNRKTTTSRITTSAPLSNKPCKLDDDQDGECVPRYLCSDGMSIIQDGSYIVDPRRKREAAVQCSDDILQVCCGLKNKLGTTTLSAETSSKTACSSGGQKGKCVLYYECEYEKTIFNNSTSGEHLCGKSTEVCCDLTKPSASEVLKQKKTEPGSKICDLDDKTKGRCVPFYLCNSNNSVSGGCSDSNNVCCRSNATAFTTSTNCGKRNINGLGFKADETPQNTSKYAEFPWMVAILKKTNIAETVLNVYKCGGSLINPRVVLTAAHCIKDEDPSNIVVRAGEWDTQLINEPHPHQNIDAKHIIVHPSFKNGGQINDIAIVILHYDFKEAENVGYICLPPADYVPVAQSCLVSGWGKDVFGLMGKYSTVLKKVEIPIVDHKTCENALRQTKVGVRFVLNPSFICAGGKKDEDVCKGDGGSPLVCKMPNSERYMQTGIVSWGIGCSDGIPGVYTNVGIARDWIDFELSEKGIDMSAYVKF